METSPVKQRDESVWSPSQALLEGKQGTHEWSRGLVTPLPEESAEQRFRTAPRRYQTKQLGLIVMLIALLGLSSGILLPALLAQQPSLVRTTLPALSQVTLVGQVSFSSSGQVDPRSSIGLNDTVTLRLQNLSQPLLGKGYYAWLLPDRADDGTRPLLLGKLSIARGNVQLTYVHPDHENLLASYSGFEITEQDGHQMPTMPPLDPATWRYVGSIADLPTPGDEKQYSLLDHMRHLLAKDPTLQQIGLQGGLDIWLYRNTEKILEWSSAARDSWSGGQQTDLIHRQILRVLEYLDGTSVVAHSGDIPPGSPLLVDPRAGQIGLLEVSQTQTEPAYLTHVDIHLRGLANAPGHTQEQRQLSITIDRALNHVASLMQTVHQDAVKLVKMNAVQLKSYDALVLLNEMVTNVTNAYAGQFDATIGGNTDGIVWIYDELQGLAVIPVTVASVKKPSSVSMALLGRKTT